VFQPVSSNSSTAFIPVSAVPGGVPPGTPLYGAYGQPLAPAGGPPPPGPYGAPPGDYQHPLASPTGQFPHHPDDRSDPGRRRPRGPEDEPGLRLPPPNPYNPEEDLRRRSPASNQSSNTPPNAYNPYQHSTGGSSFDADRSGTPRRNSGGSSHTTPQSGAPSSAGGGGNIMSLGNLVDQGPPPPQRGESSGHSIDQNMLGRLNRRS
jgi:hypothetical protein